MNSTGCVPAGLGLAGTQPSHSSPSQGGGGILFPVLLPPSAFGCVAFVAGCRRGGLGRLDLAFDVGEVADPVDEGPGPVGCDRAGLGVDGSGSLGFEGGLVAFEAALQCGFVEVVEAGL